MSRIGRKPVVIPENVKVEIKDNHIYAEGPLGKNSLELHPEIEAEIVDGKIVVKPKVETKRSRALHGLYRALINNLVTGVSKGFEITLEIVGIGYRATKEGENLVLYVGFSHPVVVKPKPGITFEVSQDPTTRQPLIVVKGIDKQVVGQQAAEIKAIRPPDPYHGKGIRYRGEVVHLKPGKAAKAGGA
ncbi:50S ribosomal protein L6 [bacterium]|nr:50S ribosomal protein L6 [bacterium]